MDRKKLIIIALCAVICTESTLMLSACNNNNNSGNDTSSSAVSSSVSDTGSALTNEDISESSEESQSSGEESSENSEKNSSAESQNTEESLLSDEESSVNTTQNSQNSPSSVTEQSSEESQSESSTGVTPKVKTSNTTISEFDNDAKPSADTTKFTDSKSYKYFFKYFSADNNHMKVTTSIISELFNVDMDMEYQVQGDKTYSASSSMGTSTVIIVKDGKSYSTSSSYLPNQYVVKEGTAGTSLDNFFDVDGIEETMKISESGTITVEGKNLSYEKITAIDENSATTMMIAYFDGNDFVTMDIFSTNGYYTSSEESSESVLKKIGTMNTEFNLPINEKLFELNPDYKIITEEEYYNSYSYDPMIPEESDYKDIIPDA